MCGIVGYKGESNAVNILMQGLKRLEYRGYDSSGIGIIARKKIRIVKKAGKLAILENAVRQSKLSKTTLGIGHTRWATHGIVNDANAHPHLSGDKRVAIVHNGIIDNYTTLKKDLLKDGFKFNSDTDSEVIAQLISKYLKNDPEEAVKNALSKLEGTYGLLIIFNEYPDLLIGAKKGSPLAIGVKDDSMFLASDPVAFIAYTQKVIYLDDNETAVIDGDSYRTTNMQNVVIPKNIEALDWEEESTKKGDFEHFLLKEIFEQPEVVYRAFGEGGRFIKDFGTVKLGGLNLEQRDLFDISRIEIFGMGSAYYAGLFGAYIFENLSRIPTGVVDASELIYSNPIVQKDTLYFAISQSGETADTITAIREIQNKGGRVLGIINNPGSTIARMCEGGVYIHAGPEVSVAATKTFLSQITVLSMIALLFGRMRNVSISRGKKFIEELLKIPEQITQILENKSIIKDIASKYKKYSNFVYVARGINYPIALEGALKLKEVNYVYAEGYSAGNLKHGPLALICEDVPSLFIVVKGVTYDKIFANIQEIKARKGKVIVITNVRDEKINLLADDVIEVPETDELISPLLTIIPLQLLAYYIAKECGRNIDQPRNLAKCVTTE
jgi:glucosamine--fructose-6-phosphate aminotransferase (isomerizing)